MRSVSRKIASKDIDQRTNNEKHFIKRRNLKKSVILLFVFQKFSYVIAVIKERCGKIEAAFFVYDLELFGISVKIGRVESLWREASGFVNQINV